MWCANNGLMPMPACRDKRTRTVRYLEMSFNRPCNPPWSRFVPAELLTLSVDLRYPRRIVMVGRSRIARRHPFGECPLCTVAAIFADKTAHSIAGAMPTSVGHLEIMSLPAPALGISLGRRAFRLYPNPAPSPLGWESVGCEAWLSRTDPCCWHRPKTRSPSPPQVPAAHFIFS